MNWDSKEFDQALAEYRRTFKGTDAQFQAACDLAEMYCEPSGCKDASPANHFFSYLEEELNS